MIVIIFNIKNKFISTRHLWFICKLTHLSNHLFVNEYYMCTLKRYVYVYDFFLNLCIQVTLKNFNLSLLKIIFSYKKKIYVVFAFAELINFYFSLKGSMDG